MRDPIRGDVLRKGERVTGGGGEREQDGECLQISRMIGILLKARTNTSSL